MADIAKLNIMLTGNIGQFVGQMKTAGDSVEGFGSKVASVVSGLAIYDIGKSLVTGLVSGVTELGKYAIKLAADAEQAKVSFTVMLGSAEKAVALQKEINKFAAATPFQTTELVDASKKLLAFGVAQQQIIPTMRTLGDLAAGLNIPIGELAELYGKAKVQGRLMAEDVNQLVGRGIPVIQEFAKQFGVSEGEVKKLVESGKIGFPQLQQALVSLTAQGGKFSGLMEAQSKTVAGLFSTVQDTIDQTLTSIGQSIIDGLDVKAALNGVTEAMTTVGAYASALVKTVIGDISGMGITGANAGTSIIAAMKGVITTVAYLGDFLSLLEAGWYALKAIGAVAFLAILEPLNLVNQAIGWLVNKLTGSESEFAAFSQGMIDGLRDVAKESAILAGQKTLDFADGKSSAAVAKFFSDVDAQAAMAAKATTAVGDAASDSALKIEAATASTVKAADANNKVADTLAKLRKEVEEFGLSTAQKQQIELKSAGATEAQLAEAAALNDKLDLLKEQKKQQDELARDAAQHAKAQQDDADKHAETLAKVTETAAPRALEAGSKDAESFVADIQKRQRGEDAAKDALDEAKKSSKYLAIIAGNTKQPVTEDATSFNVVAV